MKISTGTRLNAHKSRARKNRALRLALRLAHYRNSPTTGNCPPEYCRAPLKVHRPAAPGSLERARYATNASTGFQPPHKRWAPARDTMVPPVPRALRRLKFDNEDEESVEDEGRVEDEPVSRDDFEMLLGELFEGQPH